MLKRNISEESKDRKETTRNKRYMYKERWTQLTVTQLAAECSWALSLTGLPEGNGVSYTLYFEKTKNTLKFAIYTYYCIHQAENIGFIFYHDEAVSVFNLEWNLKLDEFDFQIKHRSRQRAVCCSRQ